MDATTIEEFDVFISYSRRDSAPAQALERALRRYRPPAEVGLPRRYLRVFRDQSDFRGTEYESAVRRHLSSSRKLVVICSPAAARSKFVDAEIQFFAEQRGAQHIIPLLWSGIPNNEAVEATRQDCAFPPALVRALSMPLAVDYRGIDLAKDRVNGGADGRWYALLANIYDIARAEIEQRERKRKSQLVRYWISGLSVVVLALASIATWALFSRAEARRQEQISRAKQLTAQSRAMEGAETAVAQRRVLLAAEALARLDDAKAERGDADAALADALGRIPLLVKTFPASDANTAIAFSSDGLVLWRGEGTRLQAWSLHTRNVLLEAPLNAAAIQIIAGGHPSEFAVIDNNNVLTLWSGANGSLVAGAQVENAQCAQFDEHQQRIIVATLGKPKARARVTVHSVPDMKVMASSELPEGSLADPSASQGCISFSPYAQTPEIVLIRTRYERADEEPQLGAVAWRLPKAALISQGWLVAQPEPPAATKPRPRAMSAAAVAAKVRRTIAEQLGVEVQGVDPRAHMVDDLGADELDLVEVVMAIEEEFQVEVPDEEAETFATVGDVIRWVEANRDRSPPVELREWNSGEQLQFQLEPYRLLVVGERVESMSPGNWVPQPVGIPRPAAISPGASKYIVIRSLGTDPYVVGLESAELEIRNLTDKAKVAEAPGGGAAFWQFTRDGEAVVTAHGTLLRFWSASGPREIRRIVAGFQPTGVLESPAGRYVAVFSADHAVEIWDTAHMQEQLRTPRRSLAKLSPDGKLFATAAKGWLQVIDIQSGANVTTVPFPATPTTLRWSAQGGHIAVYSQGMASLADLLEPRQKAARVFALGNTEPVWSGQDVKDIALTADGSALVVIHGDGSVEKLALSGKSSTWKIKIEHARHVSFSASGKYLAIGTSSIYADDNYDFGLVLVDAANGNVVRTFEGSFRAAEIDEAARRIALSARDAKIEIHALLGSEPPIALPLPQNLPHARELKFSAANRLGMLVTSTGGNIFGSYAIGEGALVWDLSSRKMVAEVPAGAFGAPVSSTSLLSEELPHLVKTVFNADGSLLAATQFDSSRAYWQVDAKLVNKYAMVWNLSGSLPQEIFRRAGSEVVSITESGSSVLLTSGDAWAVWSVRPAVTAMSACSRVGRSLTAAEQRTYLDADKPRVECLTNNLTSRTADLGPRMP